MAIELQPAYIISADGDLLSLRRGRDNPAKRFRQRLPGVTVLEAAAFISKHQADLKKD